MKAAAIAPLLFLAACTGSKPASDSSAAAAPDAVKASAGAPTDSTNVDASKAGTDAKTASGATGADAKAAPGAVATDAKAGTALKTIRRDSVIRRPLIGLPSDPDTAKKRPPQ